VELSIEDVTKILIIKANLEYTDLQRINLDTGRANREHAANLQRINPELAELERANREHAANLRRANLDFIDLRADRNR